MTSEATVNIKATTKRHSVRVDRIGRTIVLTIFKHYPSYPVRSQSRNLISLELDETALSALCNLLECAKNKKARSVTGKV